MPDYATMSDEELMQAYKARQKPAATPDYNSMSDADLVDLYNKRKGKAPDEDADVIQEMHPDIDFTSRLAVKNLSNDSGNAIQYLQEQHPELQFAKRGSQITAKRPNEKAWRVLDPEGFDWQDLTDIGTDAIEAVGSGAATVAGGLAFGLPGAMAAGAGSSAGLDFLKQQLSKAVGTQKEYDYGQAAMSTGFGAASPLLFGSGATAGKIAEKALKKGLGQEATEQLARQQKSAVRRMLPKAGEFMSGAPAEILEDAPRYLERIKTMEGDDGLLAFGQGLSERVIGNVQKARTVLQDSIGEGLEKAKYEFRTDDLMEPVESALTKMRNNADRAGGFSEADKQVFDEITAMKKHLFNMVDESGESLGYSQRMQPKDLMRLMQYTKAYSKSLMMPPGTSAATKKLFRETEGIAAEIADIAGSRVDDALEAVGSPKLREDYADLMKMARDILPKFSDAEKTVDTLRKSGSKNKQVLFQKLKKYDQKLGLTGENSMADNVKLLEQYRIFADPSMSQTSMKGATSTSVTKRGASIGGLIGGAIGSLIAPGVGTGIGVPVGAAAMAAINSPAAYKAAIKAGMKVGKAKDMSKEALIKILEAGANRSGGMSQAVRGAGTAAGRAATSAAPRSAWEYITNRDF